MEFDWTVVCSLDWRVVCRLFRAISYDFNTIHKRILLNMLASSVPSPQKVFELLLILYFVVCKVYFPSKKVFKYSLLMASLFGSQKVYEKVLLFVNLG